MTIERAIELLSDMIQHEKQTDIYTTESDEKIEALRTACVALQDVTYFKNDNDRLRSEYVHDTMYFHNKWMECEAKLKKKPNCQNAEWSGGKCNGYGKSENDDEPIDVCMGCPKNTMYGIE